MRQHIKLYAKEKQCSVNTIKNHIRAGNIDAEREEGEIFIIVNFKSKRFEPHRIKLNLKDLVNPLAIPDKE